MGGGEGGEEARDKAKKKKRERGPAIHAEFTAKNCVAFLRP